MVRPHAILQTCNSSEHPTFLSCRSRKLDMFYYEHNLINGNTQHQRKKSFLNNLVHVTAKDAMWNDFLFF